MINEFSFSCAQSALLTRFVRSQNIAFGHLKIELIPSYPRERYSMYIIAFLPQITGL